MSHIQLKARSRNKNKKERGVDEIPAVIYGPNSENQNLAVDYREFAKTYEKTGKSTLIDLAVDEKDTVKVLIQDMQKDPVSDRYIHVDFYQLDINKKLTIDVELIFEGIEEVEKATGAEVIKNLSTIQISCLPKDLVKEITIDITDKLKKIGDSLNASDIALPEGLKLVSDPENSVVSLQEIKEEIIEAPKAEEGSEGEEKAEDEDEAGKKGEEKAEDKGEAGKKGEQKETGK